MVVNGSSSIARFQHAPGGNTNFCVRQGCRDMGIGETGKEKHYPTLAGLSDRAGSTARDARSRPGGIRRLPRWPALLERGEAAADRCSSLKGRSHCTRSFEAARNQNELQLLRFYRKSVIDPMCAVWHKVLRPTSQDGFVCLGRYVTTCWGAKYFNCLRSMGRTPLVR